MLNATKKLLHTAIQQRDEATNALRDDRADQALQQRLQDFESGIGEGWLPTGRVAELISKWEPRAGYGVFETTYQRANAEVIQSGLGGVLLPKLEAVFKAHRALLNDLRRTAERPSGNRPLTMPPSLEPHCQALSDLIGIVNALPVPAESDVAPLSASGAESGGVGATITARQKRFRVALSFPGERREFVEQVATRLAASVGRERVLYDKYYEAEFARIDLDTYLQQLYHEQSELIAVFLCADYERKEWCGLEWRAIRDLIKRRQASTVMPFRFDNTEIPGLFSTDGYVSIDDRTPEDIADRILERLRINSNSAPGAASSRAE